MPDFNLHLKDMGFAYKDCLVLDNLNLEICSRQSIGLIGANGSGKTTLFRCIAGLEKATKGLILYNGTELRTESDFRIFRRHIGFALQNAEDQFIFPTVIEDVIFGPLNLGLDEDAARTRALEILKLLDIADSAHRLTHELSGGQQKLAALAAVLAMRPQLLLLDEPFNGLDHNATERLLEVIGGLDCAKIIVSHDPALLERVCAKCLLLENGVLRSRLKAASNA